MARPNPFEFTPPTPALTFAKWPPDDADLPDVVPGPGGGYAEDGNFKRGAIKPVFIGLVALTLIGGGAAFVMMSKTSAEKTSVADEGAEKKSILLLSHTEQIPKWRAVAVREDMPHLRQDAFAELAWVKDPQSVDIFIKALTSSDHRIRGRAAQALLEYAPDDAIGARAKPALVKALGESGDNDRGHIAWCLVAYKEQSKFADVMELYRKGEFRSLQRIDDSPAFDPEVFSQMVPLEKFVAIVNDPAEKKKENHDSVKQLVASALSRTSDAKWTSELIKLVDDPSIEVAREAAVGLGRIANEASLAPLVNALERADKDSRTRFLEALRDGVGAKGLVIALRSAAHPLNDKEKANIVNVEKSRLKQIFDMLKDLEDPRGGDALNEYLATNPKPHWRTEAALRMAEVGDTRGASVLGWRLKEDPLKLYNKIDDPELMRDDNERVVSARMLADLAVLYSAKRNELLGAAEGGAMQWLTTYPQPHANGLRFLANAGSRALLPKLRGWADPTGPMPKLGETNMPDKWNPPLSALRYLGLYREPANWSLLEKQLNRKTPKLDISEGSIAQGGSTALAMSLGSLARGAANGFSEWGDPKAFPILVKFIENPENNEFDRRAACDALAWASTDAQMEEVSKKVFENDKPADPKSSFLRGCFLQTLQSRPVPTATGALVDLLKAENSIDVRLQAARAMGFAGVTADTAKILFEKMKDNSVRNSAAIALLIGGDRETAMRAMSLYEEVDDSLRESMKDDFAKSFAYWSDKNYEHGDVQRWIDNAEACAHVRVKDKLQTWMKQALSHELQQEYDNGPHSMTRVQLRVRLYNDAKAADPVKQRTSVETLKFLREKGVLMALRHEPGELGEHARKAFFEIMNPQASDDRVPTGGKSDTGKKK